ncbi:hypothetical protein H5P28_00230 [Ruficoccus amylovorans]|uniref:Uncharacterized protein n=1 Tax=Ruficoccus amylovorans TaxID=1804625 RepID=A0A842H994_9BACT|nr:hypothetical protein [Ruficoccus amylovorans]MBC2592678.1 hypothetical protein [Ruficoccus amylovorans]
MPAVRTAYLDFLLPARSHVTAKELAGACGYSARHILSAIESGRLGAFQVPGRGTATNLHTRIPIEVARAFLVSHSTGLDDVLVVDQFARALARLPRPLLAAVHAEAAKQLRQGHS